ncbi:FUSC family protein [Clostridium sp.]|uniref:FUSC family protein n=1 Tax=Clostridium sp. TaxID=1506 RepID=UPI003F315F09
MEKNSNKLISLIISKTVIFIVVVLSVASFKSVFKEANSTVGVTTIVLALSFLGMDLTLNPLMNFTYLLGANIILGIGSFIAVQNIFLGILINLLIMLFIGYFFSFKISKPLNMLVGLHYILMLTNSVTIEEMPLRLASLVAGAVIVMLLQFVANRNKLEKSSVKEIQLLKALVLSKIEFLASNENISEINEKIIEKTNEIESLVFYSGKKNGAITEGGKSVLRTVAAYENINITLESNTYSKDILVKLHKAIELLQGDLISVEGFEVPLKILVHEKGAKISNQVLDNTDGIEKNKIEFNSTRFIYGLKLGSLVALSFFAVKYFNIEFGEWIVYTVFALTQPHYEYSREKSKKRVWGTLIGAMIIAIVFSIFKESEIRTLLLVLFGYLMSYVSDYRNVVVFVTLSSIASAAVLVADPGNIIFARVLFVLVGAGISIIVNRFILKRSFSHELSGLYDMVDKALEKIKESTIKNESFFCIAYMVPALVEGRIHYLSLNDLKKEDEVFKKEREEINKIYINYISKII